MGIIMTALTASSPRLAESEKGKSAALFKNTLRGGAAIVAAAMAMLASPAMAQDEAEQEPETAEEKPLMTEDGAMEMMVVTARRREERLIDVPLSITSLDGDALVASGVQDIIQAAQQVPNVTLEVSRGTNTTLTAFIRGIGQQDPVAGFEAGVGLYIDDVYLNRPQAAVLDIYDVERVEVLRGPQGTLYGRNTIGGAIKYVTKRLPDETAVKVRGTYGSFDQADLIVTASTPITDTLRIGGSAARLSRGGFGDNLVQPGVENYNRDIWAGRASLEFDNGPLFVRLSGDYLQDNSDPRQGHRLIESFQTGAPVLDDVFDTRAGLSVPEQQVEAYGGALNISYVLNDNITLRSITAYREDKSSSPIDFDSLPAADLDVPVIYENDQFSQEFQLLYESDKLNGLVGFYYLNANAFNVFDVLLDTTGQLIGLPGLNAQTLGDVKTETWSVFADFTYDLTDTLSLSVGGRYTSDQRDAQILRTSFFGGFSDFFGGQGVPFATTSDFNGSQTFEDFAPRASIAWSPDQNHNIYFTFSQGFKGGGFDPRGQTSAAPDFDQDGVVSADEVFNFLQFDPEEVDSYELGWKASFLDNRLNISVAGFLQNYRDVQIPGSVGLDTDGDGINDTFTGVTSNAADASVNGIEFEGSALAGLDFWGLEGSSFRVNWALGYLDAEFNTFIDNFGVDVADQRVFQNTPDWTANVGTNLGLPLGNGTLNLFSQISMRSDASQFEVPNEFLDQDGFVLVDASLTWTSEDETYSIGLHGKNIFDVEYIVAGYNFTAPGPNGQLVSTLGQEGTLTAFFGNPAQFFITGQVQF